MTRFTTFTDKELDAMESAFQIALDNMRFGDSHGRIENLIDEVQAERKCRHHDEEKGKISDALHDQLARHIAKSNYVLASSCDDDEKLVVLCMINKQLKEMQNTLTLLSNALIGNSEKAHKIPTVTYEVAF